MAKKAAKKAAKKKAGKSKANAKRYSFVEDLHERILDIVEVNSRGAVKIKKTDLKSVLEDTFDNASRVAAGGDRVRFPVIGALVRKEVKAVKGGKYIDPFSKEEKIRKPRSASKKPRWSFPKSVKETFADKKLW